MKRGRLLIFAAPSGAGKSTLVQYVMSQGLNTHFSISTTTRAPRGTEQHGKEYYFVSIDEFNEHIRRGDFVEFEEVYTGRFYGTLKSEVESRLEAGQNVVFDVDVNGGMNIKRQYSDQALSIFIMPPSIDELRNRLVHRATDAPEVIEQRIQRAEYEISQARNFDRIVVNDDLDRAKQEVLTIVKQFICE
ncbi:MAG: guanylate kinase [Bacteroidaceae bacterium]|nr:guanylate kinase [Bacteroidaceae bacterium]